VKAAFADTSFYLALLDVRDEYDQAIHESLTSDRHFEQAGFKALLT
jgi:predicted nucleic acid-binding protein